VTLDVTASRYNLSEIFSILQYHNKRVDMKKVLVAVMALGMMVSAANAGLKYECNRYINGNYEGYINVVANNKAEAEKKAYAKYKYKLKYKVDYVKCK